MSSLKARAGGLCLLAIGVALGWFFLLRPLQQAYAGIPEVRYQLKAFLLVPLCIVFGLAFLLLGENFDYRDVERKSLKPIGWVLFVVIAVATAGGYWWFQQAFSALGYRSGP